MAEIKVIPNVLIHEFSTGASLSGVAPTGGSDSEETIKRGRYRRYYDLTDGGLVDIEESVAINGFRLKDVLISAPGITAAIFYVVDRDSNDVCAGSATITAGNGFVEWIEPGLLVAPGCKFKIVGTGTLSDAGRVMFILDSGWGASIFDFAPSLGRESRPPGKIRP